MVQVNNGTWEHVDPGNWYTDNDQMTTYSSGTAYPSTPLDGERIWTDEHCDQEDFENYELSMEQWSGENIRFKFIAADKYSYSTTAHGPQGWLGRRSTSCLRCRRRLRRTGCSTRHRCDASRFASFVKLLRLEHLSEASMRHWVLH